MSILFTTVRQGTGCQWSVCMSLTPPLQTLHGQAGANIAHMFTWLTCSEPITRSTSPTLQGARQGFALALSQVLNVVPSLSGDSLLELINKELDLSASAKGQVGIILAGLHLWSLALLLLELHWGPDCAMLWPAAKIDFSRVQHLLLKLWC